MKNLKIESVKMLVARADKAVLDLNIVPDFTIGEIATLRGEDGRFEVR